VSRNEKSLPSLPCPVCGEFKCWPLRSPEAVDDLIRLVHTDLPPRDDAGAALTEFLLDRLHGCPELPDAPEGRCEDNCGRIGRRVRIADLQVCKPCGRARLKARDRKAA
jgi:hypothetical protein